MAVMPHVCVYAHMHVSRREYMWVCSLYVYIVVCVYMHIVMYIVIVMGMTAEGGDICQREPIVASRHLRGVRGANSTPLPPEGAGERRMPPRSMRQHSWKQGPTAL